MDLANAIQHRYGTRRYDGRRVPQDTVEQVVAAGRTSAALHPEIQVRWYIVWDGSVITHRLEGAADALEDGVRLGARLAQGPGERGGVDSPTLIAPPHYVIVVSEERPGYLENVGYRMQYLVLTAAELGLGTCWIRASARVAQSGETIEQRLLDLAPDLGRQERIVALTPLGYPDQSQAARMARQLIRWGSAGRAQDAALHELIFCDAWNVPWPSEDTGRPEEVTRAVALARRAPSWDGAHAWRFVVDERRAIATVLEPRGKDSARGARLSAGTAMCHFAVGAQADAPSPVRDQPLDAAPMIWRIPGKAEREQLHARHGIPHTCDILGVLPLAGIAAPNASPG